jgi:hypothetical protein
MAFEEILDQAAAMLRGSGRETYRMLKLQLQLYEEQLKVLKEELSEGLDPEEVRKIIYPALQIKMDLLEAVAEGSA